MIIFKYDRTETNDALKSHSLHNISNKHKRYLFQILIRSEHFHIAFTAIAQF